MNDRETEKRNWSVGWVLGIVGAVAALVVVGFVVTAVLVDSGGRVPEFPSLVDDPDPTLQGTVAYTDGNTGCVWIIAASGAASEEIYCPEPWSVDEAAKLGKPVGPQLVWMDDGRLEMTWFRMQAEPGPDLDPGWQVVVDVRTGEVDELPRDTAPSEPNAETRPLMSPDGTQVGYVSNSRTGSVEVSVTQPDGTSKTLLSAQGPGKYVYGINSAFWSPDFQWIAVDDGRILVVTVGEPGMVRVLVENIGGWGHGEDPMRANFAVTSENYLSSSG